MEVHSIRGKTALAESVRAIGVHDPILGAVMRMPKNRGPAIVGLSLFVAGPGVLLAWWIALSHSHALAPGLPGFLSDWAPTAGDTILAMAAGVMVSAYRDLSDVAHAGRRHVERLNDGVFTLLPAGIAVSLVALVTWSWLRDPAIRPNWTLPAAGVLAPPGLYHAAFSAVLLYWYLAFTLRVAVIVSSALANPNRAARAAGPSLRLWAKLNVIAASIAAYAGLLAVDNWHGALDATAPASIASTGCVVLLAWIFALLPSVYITRPLRSQDLITDAPARAEHAFTRTISMVVPLVSVATVLLVLNIQAGQRHPIILLATLILAGLQVANAWIDVYAVHLRRAPADSWVVAYCGGAVVSAGYLFAVNAAASVTLSASRIPASIAALWPSGLVAASAAVGVTFAFWLLVRGLTSPDSGHGIHYLTDDSPAKNLVQNMFQFYGALLVVVIPVALICYAVLETPSGVTTVAKHLSPTVRFGLVPALWALIALPVGLSLGNFWQHVRELAGRRPRPENYSVISGLALFVTISFCIVILLTQGLLVVYLTSSW